MHDERDLMLADLYVQDRYMAADQERLVRETLRCRRERNVLMLWMGHKLVRIGQRLEALGAAGTWEQAKVA